MGSRLRGGIAAPETWPAFRTIAPYAAFRQQ
jgi:hypothetical protein